MDNEYPDGRQELPDLPQVFPDPRRRPPGILGRAICWLLLALMVGLYALFNAVGGDAEGDGTPVHPRRLALEMQARYMVGAARLLSAAPNRKQTVDSLLAQLEKLPATDRERLMVIPVVAELGGGKQALARLEALQASAGLDADVARHARVLETIYTDGVASVGPNAAQTLQNKYHWIGRLALSYGRGGDDPLRRRVLREAGRTVAVILAFVGGLLLLVIGGLVLFILALVLAARRRIRSGYARRPGMRPATNTAFLELPIVFLAGPILLALVLHVLPVAPGPGLGMAIMWVLAAVILWPLLRGVSREDLKNGLGLHAGRGVIREVGCGLLGYVAGFPVLVAGFVVTAILTALLSESPGVHPVVEQMKEGGGGVNLALVLLMICAWAPLVEEAVFRGGFYHHLRRKLGFFPSALLTGAVFAVIHPVGFVAMPVLLALGFNLAAVREWRGSLIAPITMHAVHNGLVFLLIWGLFL